MKAESGLISGLIGNCEPMQEVYRMTRKVAPTSATVLLTGETGTGKELIARALHELSPRATGPFIRVNCGALSESLLESELFGHAKGAFTSAIETRTGRFEAAHGGTIFLDEINSVSYQLQVKLLRVLQEHEFERVGDTRTIRVDCRVIAATNVDLQDEIRSGRFRDDLFYRLNVIPIYLPALRERQEDIPDLVNFFLRRYSMANGLPVPRIAGDTLRFLTQYDWPGNVRELQNYIERALVLSTSDEITADLLPQHVRGLAPVRIGRRSGEDLESICSDLVSRRIAQVGEDSTEVYNEVINLVEKELLLQVLRQCQGVQTRAATRLGINRNTLHKKIDDHDLGAESR
jgi:DNA-binding NtrC family response regulator